MSSDDFGTARIVPNSAQAGEYGQWEIRYTTGALGIREGGSLRVSGPRIGYDRWLLGKVLAFCDLPDVYLDVQTEEDNPPSYHYCHSMVATVNVLGRDLPPGTEVRVMIGAVGGYHSGRRIQARAQTHAATTEFIVMVDAAGNGQFNREYHRKDAYQPCGGDLSITVVPAPPRRIQLVVRPQPKAGDELIGVAAIQDAFHNTVEDLEAELRFQVDAGEWTPPADVTKPSGEAGVTFRVPASTGAEIAYLSASDYRRGLYGISNPIAPGFHGERCAYFGDMHVMTGSSGIRSMIGTTESALRYARDVSGLDFTAVTNSFRPNRWAGDVALFKSYNRDHEFVTIPSLECGFKTGHKNVFFLNDDEPPVHYQSAELLFESLAGRTCTVIAHHPNTHAETDRREWGPHDLSTIDPRFERHIEICQSRGSFEYDEPGDEVKFGGYGSSVRDVLALGHRLGFVGGTDSHRAQPGLPATNLSGLHAEASVTGAITAVIARELTREAIWEALLERRCYATTCVRILLDFELNGQPMGSDIDLTDGNHEGTASRELRIRVAGTYPLDRLVIVRNGEEIHAEALAGLAADVSWTDDDALESVCDDGIRGVYYYAKVYQQDGNIAWASPIWLTTRPA